MKSILSYGETGSISEPLRVIECKFDKYEILIRLTDDNKFYDVSGVKIDRDFLSQQQKYATIGYHDVEKYYKED